MKEFVDNLLLNGYKKLDTNPCDKKFYYSDFVYQRIINEVQLKLHNKKHFLYQHKKCFVFLNK